MKLAGAFPIAVVLAALSACGGGDADPAADAHPEARYARSEASVERTAADWLTALPEGETKRWFVNQCAGCHMLDERVFMVDGAPRTEESWAEQTRAMIEMAGAETDFPILRPSLDPDSLAAWLSRHQAQAPPEPGTAVDSPYSDEWEVTIYPMPDPQEVPHDVAVDSSGNVLVTGMGTHGMYLLEAGADSLRRIEIPVELANPRAVEVGPAGDWWVLLGHPRMLARYSPGSEEWQTWELGAYPHEIALDGDRVWFNGHFTKDPEILGYVDVATGEVETFEVPYPAMDDGGTTVPYGLRMGRDGRVWMTQLFGGRLVAFDPQNESFEAVEFSAGAGPRRHDVAPDGRIWVPEYGANRLAVHDPDAGTLEEHEFPIDDALPYVARVDGEGAVWVGTAAAGAVSRFDPASGAWDLIRLPLEAPLARHLAVDPRSGAVWGVVSPYPARNPALFRIVRKDGSER